MKKNDFEKYATGHLGINSHTLYDYTSSVTDYVSPTIIEERQLNIATMDVFSRLMMDRIIFLGAPITDDVANIIQAQLLYLEAADSSKDIRIYINSPGGSVYAGLGIYDTMQLIAPSVSTICTGMAASMAAVLLTAGEKGKLAKDLVSTLYAVIERVMAFIIALSPIGVFTMMAWVVATQGPEILGSLAVVLGCAYLGYIVHAVLCYSFSAKAFAGISPFTFFEKASPAMIFAFTSTSSAATIPLSKECADELGAESDVSSFVIPLGATINMDGTAIYQCVATIFLATCCGMTLTLGQMVTIVVTATLASIGTAGTPGAGMIMLAMVLEAMNIPVDMIMIIYGIDRLFDMGRTCLNITGDVSCALCVTKWENKKAAQTAK